MIQQSLKFESDDYSYYFFMKAGHGNCFLPLVRKMGGLWVGYFEESIPELDEQGLCQSSATAADLQFMAVATHERYRSKIRIVTFGKDSLLIWEPTGALQYLDAAASAVDWSDSKLYSKFPLAWHREVKQKYGRVGSAEFMANFYTGTTGAKMIPAKIVCTIPRATLLSSIDSLSVWQSLNRKTFQPMFTLHGNKMLNDLEWLKNYKSIDPLPVTESRTLEESLFGKFIRLYLGGHLGQNNSIVNDLPRNEISRTALSVLNPAQLETAVMHLCRDLGLIIDVGFGKGLDVADIKATVRHLPTRERASRVNHALSVLEQTGVKFSSKLKCEIQATSTIRVQCKAYSNVDPRNLGNTLLAVPTLSNSDCDRTDCVELERVSKMDRKLFPELFGWLNLLESDLCHRLKRAW